MTPAHAATRPGGSGLPRGLAQGHCVRPLPCLWARGHGHGATRQRILASSARGPPWGGQGRGGLGCMDTARGEQSSCVYFPSAGGNNKGFFFCCFISFYFCEALCVLHQPETIM